MSWGKQLAVLPPVRPHHKVAAETGLSHPEPVDDEVGGKVPVDEGTLTMTEPMSVPSISHFEAT